MNVPISGFDLETQRVLWVKREKVAFDRLRHSRTSEARRGALGDLRAVRAELDALRHLYSLNGASKKDRKRGRAA